MYALSDSGISYYTLQPARADDRAWNQLRPLFIDLGVVSQVGMQTHLSLHPLFPSASLPSFPFLLLATIEIGQATTFHCLLSVPSSLILTSSLPSPPSSLSPSPSQGLRLRLPGTRAHQGPRGRVRTQAPPRRRIQRRRQIVM